VCQSTDRAAASKQDVRKEAAIMLHGGKDRMDAVNVNAKVDEDTFMKLRYRFRYNGLVTDQLFGISREQ